MDRIVNASFSTGFIDKNLDSYISQFQKAFLATEISETLKVHVLTAHLKKCLEFLENRSGLGIWSEQAGESVHREFLVYWARQKINFLNTGLSFIKRLKNAVVKFSSEHI